MANLNPLLERPFTGVVKKCAALALCGAAFVSGQAADTFSDWVTFSANLDAGYRNTQFYTEAHK